MGNGSNVSQVKNQLDIRIPCVVAVRTPSKSLADGKRPRCELASIGEEFLSPEALRVIPRGIAGKGGEFSQIHKLLFCPYSGDRSKAADARKQQG